MNRLLIWDIDGTLIQGKGIGRRSMECAFFDLYGIENALKDIEMAGMLDSVIVRNAHEYHGIIDVNIEMFFERYCYHLDSKMKELTSSIAAPGILELLEKLKEMKNIYNVLGTGNIEKGARIKLSQNNLNQYFTLGGFGDTVSKRWQIIEGAVKKAQAHYGFVFEKNTIFVIGDTPKDVECAKILGYKSIGVSTGIYTPLELNECGADFVFESFANISDVLNILNCI